MGQYDLRARSRRAMLESGFEPEFRPEVKMQARDALERLRQIDALAQDVRDLRHLLWSSIDNSDSLDLDQLEYVEQIDDRKVRLHIAIADVDWLAPIGSSIDLHAERNRCTVYTGVDIYPMLPEELSTEATSLRDGRDRFAVVISMDVSEDGGISNTSVCRAVVQNRSRLSYDEVGAWLEGDGAVPQKVAGVDGLDRQIRIQARVSRWLLDQRVKSGALDFETIEAQPVMQDGHIVDLHVPHKNAARSIIENLMVTANSAIAEFLEAREVPSLQRVVRAPARWDRIVDLARRVHEDLPPVPDPIALSQFLIRRRNADPVHFPDLSLSVVKLLGAGEYEVVKSAADHVGHFGLAVHSYTHSTAPNRRYADILIQRLLKATLAGTPAPYTEAQLSGLARGCTERENAARKVERLMRKVAAAVMLSDRIGSVFDAIVTGASNKGTYTRVLHPPVEGCVTRNAYGLDVGDRVRVRLIHTDPDKGHIDFECL